MSKKVIITGASRGVGRGIARVLGKNGFHVGLLARSEEKLREVADEVNASEGKAFWATADLRDEQQTTDSIAKLIEQLGGLDVLVNNAGVVIFKTTLELSSDEWRQMIETNVHGVFYATRAALPTLLEQGNGHVVNISSIGGYHPIPGASGYAASKHAVTGFSDSLMQEVRQQGVKVTTVFPGSVDTSSEPADAWKLSPEEIGETCLHVLQTSGNYCISRVEMRPLQPPKR
ncbi:MAG: SDR family NAD(P)-dependent oxidoreductase [Phycisphaeraceae bacterium]